MALNKSSQKVRFFLFILGTKGNQAASVIQCVQDVQNIKLDELSALIGREELGRRSECVRCSNGNLSCKSHDVITAELTWTGSHLTMSNVHLATTWVQ